MAVVRCACRTRAGREILDRDLWIWHRGRLTTDETAAHLPQQMDLAGRCGGVPHLPAEPAVESALRLAIPAIDSGHPRRRARRGAGAVGFFPATAIGVEPNQRPYLVDRAVRAAIFGSSSALPGAGLELPGRIHGLLLTAWQELLPFADLPHAAGGRGAGHRTRN